MEDVRGEEHAPGEFRKLQVAIGSSRRFVPPPPLNIQHCLDEFERYLHEKDKFDPLVDCFLVHYQFEAIHPFRDGNGRVGRLLMAMMIQQRCQLSHPWLYLSDYFARNREEYIQRLFHVSVSNHWAKWVEFCLRGTAEQATKTIERCDRLRSLREDYMRRLENVGGKVRMNRIVDDLFHLPMVRVVDLPARLGITYPTAKADLDRLVAAGILAELEGEQVRAYYAPEIFQIVYADME
jgi:Fic family protein